MPIDPNRTAIPLSGAPGRVLIVFVDGVGLGADGPGNPFVDRALPSIGALARGRLVAGCAAVEPHHVVREVDATLGVEGLPQSGTGQTTLFTGVNAARALGRHVPAFPGPKLKAFIEAEGLLARVASAGRCVTFANAFTPSYLRDLAAGTRRASVTVHATQCAGVSLRTEADLLLDQAVTWDFERDFYRRAVGEHVPAVGAERAGAHLAAIAARHHLTLYETFLTDLVGHGRIPMTAGDALERLDRFFSGLLAALDETLTLVVSSDHGNVEEPGHARHTRNPVPMIAIGPEAARFAGADSIADLSPGVLAALGVEPGARDTVSLGSENEIAVERVSAGAP
jgi:hypothetical protein